MPLFGKKQSPEDKERQAQAAQEAAESIRLLEAGRLPVQAQRRLQAEMEVGHPLFTSDLSTNELLLTRRLGYQPLSQVMGSSIYQVGWQYQRTYAINTQASELTVISNAHQNAAQLALSRLEQEAALLRAHGVIGVRFFRRDQDWASNLIEYTAIGTAVRIPNMPLGEHPFLSDLSGQEFWTLLQAGYYPTGIVTGYCSYFVALGRNYTNSLKSWFGTGVNNQELQPFTQGLYNARHHAMSRATQMAQRLNAFGVVGMHIEARREVMEYERERYEHGPTDYYMDLSIHFAAMGTAITAQRKDHVIPTPKPTLTLTDLRPGRYGQNSELTLREG
jgi:uncharacterized protein YbjQ (UPF0145 family)